MRPAYQRETPSRDALIEFDDVARHSFLSKSFAYCSAASSSQVPPFALPYLFLTLLTPSDVQREAAALRHLPDLLVFGTERTMEAYLHAGRAVERMWLTSTKHGLALHPMTSLPYLLTHFEDGHGSGFDENTKALCSKLLFRYRQLFPIPADWTHVFLFRVSYAEETTGRSLRRHVESVLTMPTV